MSAVHDTPQPWRARMRQWAKPPRELVMTTSGKFLCLITLGIGFGAVNTGNNLLFLLLGMLLALILASGVLSEAVVARVTARRKLPQRLVAGVGAPGSYSLTNDKSWASLSIEVGDRNALAIAGPARGLVVGPPSIAWWKVWKGAPEQTPVSNTYSLRLESRSESGLPTRFTFSTRGRYELNTLRITTKFPFGLFEKSRTIDAPAEVVVYPSGLPASDWVATVRGRFGEVPTNKRGKGDEFFGLRDYRLGEDHRQIHWKSTARRGSAVIRENEALTQREVELVFCDWSERPLSPAAFEHGVSKCVGLINSLAQMGWRVGLRTREATIEPATGGRHVDRMLGAMAVVQPNRAPMPLASAAVSRVAIGAPDALAAVEADVRLPLRGEADA